MILHRDDALIIDEDIRRGLTCSIVFYTDTSLIGYDRRREFPRSDLSDRSEDVQIGLMWEDDPTIAPTPSS